MVGGRGGGKLVPPTIQTFVKFRDLMSHNFLSLSQTTFKLGNFTKFNTLFSAELTDMSKAEKKKNAESSIFFIGCLDKLINILTISCDMLASLDYGRNFCTSLPVFWSLYPPAYK